MGKYRHRSGALKLVLTVVTAATLVSDSVERNSSQAQASMLP